MAQRLVVLTDEDISLIHDTFARCPDLYSSLVKVRAKLDKSQNRITIASAKGKGREFQYFCCQWISDLLNIPYNQHDDDCLIHSREMGQQGVDIVLRGKAREVFPFDCETKATKELMLIPAVEQAEKNSKDGRLGVVFYRQTNQKPLVVMSLNVFKSLCERFILRKL